MGKKQHSKDRMYLTATEWQRDFGGHKGAAAQGDFARLELDCCSISFMPFTHPVCSPQGHIFELENIVPYVQKYHRNPCNNEAMELAELIKLHFARDADGELQDPVLHKVGYTMRTAPLIDLTRYGVERNPAPWRRSLRCLQQARRVSIGRQAG